MTSTITPSISSVEEFISSPIPRMRNSIATSVSALGAGLAAYLGWLKAFDLPCVTSQCGQVINSSYGTLLGLPTGYLGLIFWTALFLPLRFPRRLAALILGAGSLGFMYIQFLVLQSFCVYCTAHAVLAVTAGILVWGDARPLVGALVLPLILPLPLLAFQRQQIVELQRTAPVLPRSLTVASAPAHTKAQAVSASPAVLPTESEGGQTISGRSSILPPAIPGGAALRWLGTPSKGQTTPLLVVSLTCHHCIDTLTAALHHPRFGKTPGSRVLLGVSPQTFEMSQYIVAATLLYETPSDGFTAVFSHLIPMRDMVISNNIQKVKAHLLARFPRLTEKLIEAEQILVEQERQLEPLNIVTTPTLIHSAGIIQGDVEVSDLFSR